MPATSANLGPGFDALALALGQHDEVRATLTDGGLQVRIQGEGSSTLPRDERHLVVRAMRTAFDALGGQPPGLAVSCHNTIPQGRGLGSSAAAIVAGVVAARSLMASSDGKGSDGKGSDGKGSDGKGSDGKGSDGEGEVLDDAATLAMCAEIEGHPDNVAACLLGGLTAVWHEQHRARAVRLPVVLQTAVALVPPFEVSTAAVRGLLPDRVPHADAAANAGRAALLVEALGRRPDLLLPATEDRLHQPFRAPAMPASAAVMADLRSRGIAAVISGAGPTVLALGPGAETVVPPAGWKSLHLPVDRRGATVSEGE